MNDLDFDFGDVAACQRLIQRYAHAHGRTYLDVFTLSEDTVKLFAMLIHDSMRSQQDGSSNGAL